MILEGRRRGESRSRGIEMYMVKDLFKMMSGNSYLNQKEVIRSTYMEVASDVMEKMRTWNGRENEIRQRWHTVNL